LGIPAEVINAAYETGSKLQHFTQTAADAVKQLVESKNVAEKYARDLREAGKEKYKEEIKASGEITKAIDSVIALFIGKEDKRQGITRNPEMSVMQRISMAESYVRSRPSGMTTTEKMLLQFAADDLKKALDRTNGFFDTRWNAYREEIEQMEVSPFKKTRSFSLSTPD
jgi:hypothetical protein